jgi:hypothetical protein
MLRLMLGFRLKVGLGRMHLGLRTVGGNEIRPGAVRSSMGGMTSSLGQCIQAWGNEFKPGAVHSSMGERIQARGGEFKHGGNEFKPGALHSSMGGTNSSLGHCIQA